MPVTARAWSIGKNKVKRGQPQDPEPEAAEKVSLRGRCVKAAEAAEAAVSLKLTVKAA